MDDTLQLMIELESGPMHELFAGLRSDDLTVKARRVQLGVKNLPPGGLDETQRGVIGAGVDAAAVELARRT